MLTGQPDAYSDVPLRNRMEARGETPAALREIQNIVKAICKLK